MSVHKRGNNWYVNFWHNRIRYRKRSPDNSKAGAQLYESLLLQKLARGESLQEKQAVANTIVPTFANFSHEWMTSYVETNNKFSEIRNKRHILKADLIPFFGKTNLDQITSRSVEEYKAFKMKYGLKNKTINNQLSCLRKCLNTALEWDIITKVPRIKLLKVPPSEVIFLKPHECDALLQAATGDWREMIFTVLRTGLRFGELIALKWSDIDFESRILTVQRNIVRGIVTSPKSNKARKIYLSADLLEVLAKRKRTSEYIFIDEKGNVLRQDPCRVKILFFAQQAGIRRIGWHTLRHTFASHLANNGITIQAIQALLGHSDLKTTMRYAHLASETLINAINVLQTCSAKIWTQNGHKEQKEEILNISN
ncbi:MAG: site-specific integrase [Candidatus Magasanikbacteria bacterium]|nr:site-specific integrase [Candidatus Magasanikbacteria bacterium]